MKRVELKEYEVNDIIRTLNYAKQKKKEDYEDGKINKNQYNYETGIICDLLSIFPVKTYAQKNKIDKDLFDEDKYIKIM